MADLHDSARPILRDMRSEAFTKIQRRAVRSVEAARRPDGIELKGGGGSGLGDTLFAGGEYGGRKARKRPYAARSRRGTPYVVYRRTTMQFLPHLGREGYFYWPTIREWMPRLVKAQQKLVEQAMGGR